MTWQPIETAPDLERVIVCGWQPPCHGVRGYWWWEEDRVSDGKAITHPHAMYWCPVNLPQFPHHSEQDQ